MEIVAVYTDDWAGLYLDGILVHEGHSIPQHVWVEVTGGESIELPDPTWVEEQGGFPTKLKDLPDE